MYKFIKNVSDSILDEKEINRIEKKYSFIFPKKLKEFYLKYNACEIFLCIFTINEQLYELSEFLPLINGDDSVEKIRDEQLYDNFIPSQFIPFANDRGGDYYYWNCNDNCIYLIRFDSINKPKIIAESFSDLFNILEQGL